MKLVGGLMFSGFSCALAAVGQVWMDKTLQNSNIPKKKSQNFMIAIFFPTFVPNAAVTFT